MKNLIKLKPAYIYKHSYLSYDKDDKNKYLEIIDAIQHFEDKEEANHVLEILMTCYDIF